jgi:hypothetical protein
MAAELGRLIRLLEDRRRLEGGGQQYWRVLHGELLDVIPHDAMVVYLERGNTLMARHVYGTRTDVFESREIKVGQGVSGWVAENQKPIVNGNATVEPVPGIPFLSALSAPLQAGPDTPGVLTLYSLEREPFSEAHLQILLSIASGVTLAPGAPVMA